MVTGEQASKRAIEQSSNRATEHTTNQFIHPMHGSVLHPALSPVLRTRTYITRARNMYDVLFCESQLAKTRAPSGHDYYSCVYIYIVSSSIEKSNGSHSEFKKTIFSARFGWKEDRKEGGRVG